jgi:hypothetical protein
VRKKYLELPIVLFEVLKIVPTPSDFEHVQKLRANFRLIRVHRKSGAYGASPGPNEKAPAGQN